MSAYVTMSGPPVVSFIVVISPPVGSLVGLVVVIGVDEDDPSSSPSPLSQPARGAAASEIARIQQVRR
jgi:hypothetical protein